jgi:hypothetical protein
MKKVLSIVNAILFLLFLGLFSTTYLSPQTFESTTRQFIQYQIEKEIKAEYISITHEKSFSEKTALLVQKMHIHELTFQQFLENQLPAKIAEQINIAESDRKNLTSSITHLTQSVLKTKIQYWQIGQKQLSDIIKGKYFSIIYNLQQDLRIFFGINAFLFLILLIISLVKINYQPLLIIPATLLYSSITLAAVFYLFGQNWFYTLIYNDYIGFSYLIYISGIFLLLVDIVLNKAKILVCSANMLGTLLDFLRF